VRVAIMGVIPKIEVLDKEDIEKIHEASLRILNEVGVGIYCDDALKILDEAGASVDYTHKIVRIPEDLVMEAVKKAPSIIKVFARNPKHNLVLGEGKVYFTNGFGATKVLEEGKIRPATLEDLRKFTLICDALEHVHWIIPHIIPQDIPKEVCDRYMALTMLENTSKHTTLLPFSPEGLQDIIKMATIVAGGEEEFRKKSTLIGYGPQPTSPLQYSYESATYLMILSKHKALIDICVGPIAGATAPATLAGTLAQGNAEFLAGLVLCQVTNPGTPVLYGSMATTMDLRHGTFTCGPELALMNICFKQLASYYNLPFYGTGGVTDSTTLDAQSIYEGVFSDILEALAGVDVIHDGVYGILEVGMIANYEHLVIFHEIVSMIMYMLKGIEVNEETLAFDLIKKVGPGRSFLEVMDALKFLRQRMHKEYWLPDLTVRLSRKDWEAKGAKDIAQRAKEKVEQILREHEPEPLDRDVKRELEKIVSESTKKYAKHQ